MTAEPTTSPLVLRRLSPGDDLTGVSGLLNDYVAEAKGKVLDGYGVSLEEDNSNADQIVDIAWLLAPPQCLYLAEVDGRPAGTGGLKHTGPDVAEIKRMYVDPTCRGRGVARAILERLIEDARAAGYALLQLETGAWMSEAHALYRRCGFVDSPPFPDPEFGRFPELERLARYMTLTLNHREVT